MISKKDLQEAIDQAIVDIIESISKVVATKDDLKNFATKDDLKSVETKLSNDLKSVETKLSNEIKDVKRQINDLMADTPTPQEFKDHEKRIKSLESAVFPS